MKKIFFIFFVFILLFSCSKRYESYVKEINISIENIQKSINTTNEELFKRYSKNLAFFNFYSLIATTGNTLLKEEIINFKPVKYSGDEKSINVDVNISYNIKSIKDLNLGIPAEIFSNIIKNGLPDRMTIVFKNENDRFIANYYKFPLRYFYMNILIPSDNK